MKCLVFISMLDAFTGGGKEKGLCFVIWILQWLQTYQQFRDIAELLKFKFFCKDQQHINTYLNLSQAPYSGPYSGLPYSGDPYSPEFELKPLILAKYALPLHHPHLYLVWPSNLDRQSYVQNRGRHLALHLSYKE